MPRRIEFLILDVARYKYPPVWVGAADFFDAMNMPDAANDHRRRGYVLVAKVAAHNSPVLRRLMFAQIATSGGLASGSALPKESHP